MFFSYLEFSFLFFLTIYFYVTIKSLHLRNKSWTLFNTYCLAIMAYITAFHIIIYCYCYTIRYVYSYFFLNIFYPNMIWSLIFPSLLGLFIFLLFYIRTSFMYTEDLVSNLELLGLMCLSIITGIICIRSEMLIIFLFAMEALGYFAYLIVSTGGTNLKHSESSLKYFTVGAISALCMLIGHALLYISLFSNNVNEISSLLHDMFVLKIISNNFVYYGCIVSLIIIAIGFCIKMYCAPFHLWILDVYKGAPLIVLFYFSIIYLPIICLIFLKIYVLWFSNIYFLSSYLFMPISIMSLICGIIGQLKEVYIRYIIGYSTINTMGIFFLVISSMELKYVSIAILLLFVYVVNICGFFCFLASFYFHNGIILEKISDFTGIFLLSKYGNYLSFLYCLFFFGISGLPPFFYFFVKLIILGGIISSYKLFFSFFFSIMSLASFFYIIRLIKLISYYKIYGTLSYVYLHLVRYSYAFLLLSINFYAYFFLFEEFLNSEVLLNMVL